MLAERVSPLPTAAAEPEIIAALQRQAAYLLRRLASDPRASSLLIGLAARARSLGQTRRMEARVAQEEVRLEASYDATLEALEAEDLPGDQVETLDARLTDISRRMGEIRAERTRVRARVALERRAFLRARKLLDIRSSV